MRKRRIFKISSSLRNQIKNILERRGIPYKEEGKDKLSLNLSGEQFHKIVVRARMEKISEEKASDIPYVHKSELGKSEVMNEVGSTFFVHE